MHHTELTRAEPPSWPFPAHLRTCMRDEKQLFFLLAQISTYCHQHGVQGEVRELALHY